ncbi:MAG TPA: hypothetical protein PLF26_06715 [Blastocatellia bacterium]|nr:hypothetical protein [Blastocatellia bacterium]
MKRTVTALALSVVVSGAIACSRAAENSNVANSAAPGANANAPAPVEGTSVVAAPAASFEQGSPQYLIAHQPDYSADVLTVTGPTKIPGKIVKKGDAWRVETTVPQFGKTVIFIRPGQQGIIVLEEKKQYAEVPADQKDLLVNPLQMTYEGLMQSGVKFDKVGAETVDGHPTIKFRGSRAGQPGEMFVYFASDLKNLLIKMDAQIENQTFAITWSNIVIDPPESSVQPPADLASAFKKLSVDDLQALFSSGSDTAPSAPPATTAPGGK